MLDLSRVLAGRLRRGGHQGRGPGSGDDTRAWGPPWWGEGDAKIAAYFICANRGKRSVAIDIANAQGIAQVQELARDADVLIENYKVGQLAKYGLDTASLQALNPMLFDGLRPQADLPPPVLGQHAAAWTSRQPPAASRQPPKS